MPGVDNWKTMVGDKWRPCCTTVCFTALASWSTTSAESTFTRGKKALLQARLNKRLRATGISPLTRTISITSLRPRMVRNWFIFWIPSPQTSPISFANPNISIFSPSTAIPALLEEKRKEKSTRIRVWSAGCSTGEEPYSLAMCILTALDTTCKWDFRILATDISTRVLEFAARGVYSDEKIQKVPQHLRSLHFQKSLDESGRNQYRVSEHLKRIVTFRRLNLKEQFPFKGPFDYIFCRNVMIYFDKKTQETLINNIARISGPGGVPVRWAFGEPDRLEASPHVCSTRRVQEMRLHGPGPALFFEVTAKRALSAHPDCVREKAWGPGPCGRGRLDPWLAPWDWKVEARMLSNATIENA